MELEQMRLGVQTNVGKTLEHALWKIRKWSPPKAKSFSFKLVNTDYHGHYSDIETGYATIYVTYFDKPDEGEYRVVEKQKKEKKEKKEKIT